jgi:hypothetical protein
MEMVEVAIQVAAVEHYPNAHAQHWEAAEAEAPIL